MSAGYIYAAVHVVGHYGKVKIGQATDPTERERRLSGQSLAKIRIVESAHVDDMDAAESALHAAFADQRMKDPGTGNDTEWFNIELHLVRPLLKYLDRRYKGVEPLNVTAKPSSVKQAAAPSKDLSKSTNTRGSWHEAGWRMHCEGLTQAAIAEKFGVSPAAVVSMKKKMREAGRGNEERRRKPIAASRSADTIRPLPASAFRSEIEAVLTEFGGSGSTRDVVQAVGRRMQGRLSEADHQLHQNGREEVWEHNVHSARFQLVKRGVLRNSSPQGLWELA